MILAHRSWGDGSGRVALLAHGGARASDEWSELGRWLAERGWHTVAVDLRGHGGSPVDAATIANPSLANEAGDLVETIAALRPDAPGVDVLLGHSWGAIVGLVCVVEHPSFAERLVLLEPGGRESSDRAQYAAEKRQRYADAFNERQPGFIAQRNLAYSLARHEMFGRVDVVELASRCSVPTLLLQGRDKETPLGQDGEVMRDLEEYSAMIGAERARFRAALRLGRVHTLAAGHDFYRDRYSEFIELLSEWLAETEPSLRA